MQLSTATVPPETSLAAIFPSGGSAASSAPDASGGAGATDFAELFPDLAPGAKTAAADDGSAPVSPAAVEMAMAWAMAAQPLPPPPAVPASGIIATTPVAGAVANGDAGEEPGSTGAQTVVAAGSTTNGQGRFVSFGARYRAPAALPASGEPTRQPVAATDATALTNTDAVALALAASGSSPSPAAAATEQGTVSGAARDANGGTGATILTAGATAGMPPVLSPEAGAVASAPAKLPRPLSAGEVTARYLVPTARPPLTPPPSDSVPDSTPPVAAATPDGQKAAVPAAAEFAVDSLPAISLPATPTAAPGASPAIGGGLSPAPSVAAHNDAGTSFGGRGENFAAPDENSGAENFFNRGAPDKTFLSALEKRVTSTDSGLGIDVAKQSSAMSAATFFNRPTTASTLEHAAVSVTAPAPVEAAVANPPILAADASSAAHRAVEAVLTAADRFSSGDHHAVNLQFSVGGADLTVRVEMSANEVRTQFRTDSPELRAALAHEWQTVNGNGADRPVRLASPVFSSANGSNAGAFSGDGAPRQRDTGARRPEDTEFAAIASAGRVTSFAARPLDEFVPPAPRLIASATTLHLHALA